MANDGMRLYLIKPTLPEDPFRKQLWGNLIWNPTMPEVEFSSYKKRTPLEILPSIEAWAVIKMANYAEVLRWSRHAGGEAGVHSVLSAFFDVGTSEEEFRRATKAELYHMTAPRRQFEELLENPEWAKDALDFVVRHKGKNLYFATDILVLSNLSMGRNSASNKGVGGKFTVPSPEGVGKIASAGLDAGKERERDVAAEFADPQIIAMGYYPVMVEKTVDPEPGPAQKRPPGLTGKIVDKMKLRRPSASGSSGSSRDPSPTPKPVSRLQGELYHEETKTTYTLTVGHYMVAGPVEYMEGDSPGEAGNGETTPAAEGVMIVVDEPAAGEVFAQGAETMAKAEQASQRGTE